MKIALIPIDNRPVCYTLPKEIAKIDKDLELFLPDRKLLGGLTSVADTDGILEWLDGLETMDAIIVSLDTIAYGGLVSSRRCKQTKEEIISRLETFKTKLETKCKGKIYACSSIMRISNNNVNEEEKKYWAEYGEKLFAYSYKFHQFGDDTTEIPDEILHDYLATRHRNFTVNKMYLDWVQEGLFDTLVYSKDDCAEFGLNVLEAQILNRMIRERNINREKISTLVKTGADEIPLTLFARAICDYKGHGRVQNKEMPKISTEFLAPRYKDLISKYEDISIEQSVIAQIELSGCVKSSEEDSDIVLLVNNFEEHQGEIVMGVKTKSFSDDFDLPQKPYLVADVRFANGADKKFAESLLKKLKKDDTNFYGYSAWNTSANTLGSLICAGVVKFFAKEYNDEAFKNLQLVRFLDDLAYQANVRQALKKLYKRPDVRKLKKLMTPFEKKLGEILRVNPQINYNFPWKRYFEVEIQIK